MKHRTIGRTGIQVTPYCLGAMMFGEWGNTDHDECIRIIHAALDGGHQLHRHRRRRTRPASPRRSSARRCRAAATRSCWPRSSTCRWATTRTWRGGSRRWIIAGGREQPAPARHRLHRPVPNPSSRCPAPTSTRRSARSAISIHQGKVRVIGSSTFPAEEIVEAQWMAERRHRERFTCEQPPYSLVRARHRDRGAADLRALRHGRHRVEPARRRLADRQVPQGRRRSPTRTAPGASRALRLHLPENQRKLDLDRRAREGRGRRRAVDDAHGDGVRRRAIRRSPRRSSAPARWSS